MLNVDSSSGTGGAVEDRVGVNRRSDFKGQIRYRKGERFVWIYFKIDCRLYCLRTLWVTLKKGFSMVHTWGGGGVYYGSL